MRIAIVLGLAFAVSVAFAVSATPEIGAFDGVPAAQMIDDTTHPQQDGRPEANLPFLFAVFFITWAAFFGYIFYISRRQREMRREIDALTRALDERERRSTESESYPSTQSG